MNRRQFTALLAALPVTKLLPTTLTAAVAPQSPAVPAGTYAWAQLIARAQNRCSPAMLARQLHLGTDAAQHLYDQMLRDGVLRAPGAAGVARAAQPIDATGTAPRDLLSRLRRWMPSEEQGDEASALVKDAEPCLGCTEPQTEENPDASPDEPLQESPQRG